MKLLRYGTHGKEKPGILDDTGVLRDLSGLVDDIAGETLLPENIDRLRNTDPATLRRLARSARSCMSRNKPVSHLRT